jgi:hypothetical protein
MVFRTNLMPSSVILYKMKRKERKQIKWFIIRTGGVRVLERISEHAATSDRAGTRKQEINQIHAS